MPGHDQVSSKADRERQIALALEQLQAAPEDSVANGRVGELLIGDRRYAEALPYLQKAVEADPQRPDAWYWLGVGAGRVGDPELVRLAYEHFDRLAPQDARGIVSRANLLRFAGDWPQAMDYSRQVLSLDCHASLQSFAHWILSVCSAALDDPEGEQREIEAALALDPDSPDIVEAVARLHWDRGDMDAALPYVEQLFSLRPADAWVRYAHGFIANERGDWAEARDALRQALALGHDTFGIRIELGRALSELGDRQAAVEELRRALELATRPEEKSYAHRCLGYVYFQLKEHEKSVEHHRAAVDAEPANAQAQHGLGAMLVASDPDESLAHLEEAVRLSPDDAHAWYCLGAMLAQQGHWDRAQESLEKAISLGHPGGRARAQLAWVYRNKGWAQAALEQARRALRQGVPKKWRAWVDGIRRDCQKRRH